MTLGFNETNFSLEINFQENISLNFVIFKIH